MTNIILKYYWNNIGVWIEEFENIEQKQERIKELKNDYKNLVRIID